VCDEPHQAAAVSARGRAIATESAGNPEQADRADDHFDRAAGRLRGRCRRPAGQLHDSAAQHHCGELRTTSAESRSTAESRALAVKIAEQMKKCVAGCGSISSDQAASFDAHRTPARCFYAAARPAHASRSN
jgi:hypothetical protein